MKKLIVLLLMILPLGAIAQEVKIAFVKTQEVFMAMPEVSGMEKQMADLNEKYRVELKQMQDEYQKKYSDFVAQQDSLTENIKLRRMSVDVLDKALYPDISHLNFIISQDNAQENLRCFFVVI